MSANARDKATRLKRPSSIYTHLGYFDRVFGKGIRPTYDSWPRLAQRNYENGRLVASILMAAGIKPPVWRQANNLEWPGGEQHFHYLLDKAHYLLPNPELPSIINSRTLHPTKES